MKRTFSQFLKEQLSEPPVGLYPAVIAALGREVQKAATRRAWAVRIWLAVSSTGMLAALVFVVQDMLHSGFVQYLALMGTDTATVFTHAKEFFLLLVESAPLSGIALFFGAAFLLLEGLRSAGRSVHSVPFIMTA